MTGVEKREKRFNLLIIGFSKEWVEINKIEKPKLHLNKNCSELMKSLNF